MIPAIEIQQITKYFSPQFSWKKRALKNSSGKGVLALNNLSLTVQSGEIFGLVGRNGQGKTTLIKTIAALIEPTSGTVKVFGYDTAKQELKVKKLIGLVTSDERSFYGRLTSWQNLVFFARLYGMSEPDARQRINQLAEVFHFQEMLNRRFHALSTGNKQRLALIRALLTNPPLVLLDEPTRSLDPMAADDLHRLIRDKMHREHGKTILITSHNLAEIENLCSRVGFLSRGEIKLCASMETIRSNYFSHEQISIEVRGLAEVNGTSLLKERIPTLAWERLSPDQFQVSFSRQSGDDTLNLVIEQLLTHGAEIVACQTSRDGLKEIMAAIENE